MKTRRKIISRSFALLIIISTVSALITLTALGAGSTDEERKTAQAVFYVH